MVEINTNWTDTAERCKRRLTQVRLEALARQLKVTTKSLQDLDVDWSEDDHAYTFPERDGAGNIIGLLRRFRDGTKRVIKRSRRGLYLPRGWQDSFGPLYIPEGASDVAALLSHGLRAVGRPSCTGGVRYLCDLLIGTADEILVVGENDRKEDGRWPGRDGAKKVAATLAGKLGSRVRSTMPPDGYKDVREYLTKEVFHV
jgi:hypothetical protein